jgi:hypothetical protein
MNKISEISIEEKGMLKTLEMLYCELETPKHVPSYIIQNKIGLDPKYWKKLLLGGIIRNDSKYTTKPIYVWASIKPNIYMAIETLKDNSDYTNATNVALTDSVVERRYLSREIRMIILEKLITSMKEENFDDIKTGDLLKINPAYIKMAKDTGSRCPLIVWTRLRLWYNSGLSLKTFAFVSSNSNENPYIGEGFAVRNSKKTEDKSDSGSEIKKEQKTEAEWKAKINTTAEEFIRQKSGFIILWDNGTYELDKVHPIEKVIELLKINAHYNNCRSVMIMRGTFVFGKILAELTTWVESEIKKTE